MSRSISGGISLFRDRIENRSFADETLRILESTLASRDVASLIETRSALREVLRSESKLVLREITGKFIFQKLFILEFFIRAFALVGDTESCLALKYEALILRELESACDDSLRVLSEEWLTFSEDSLENGYHSIALKGLNSALSSSQRENHSCGPEPLTVRKIKALKHKAEELISPFSVRAKASALLERKGNFHEQSEKLVNGSTDGQRLPASLLFHRGLRTRNSLKLQKIQEMTQDKTKERNICPDK